MTDDDNNDYRNYDVNQLVLRMNERRLKIEPEYFGGRGRVDPYPDLEAPPGFRRFELPSWDDFPGVPRHYLIEDKEEEEKKEELTSYTNPFTAKKLLIGSLAVSAGLSAGFLGNYTNQYVNNTVSSEVPDVLLPVPSSELTVLGPPPINERNIILQPGYQTEDRSFLEISRGFYTNTDVWPGSSQSSLHEERLAEEKRLEEERLVEEKRLEEEEGRRLAEERRSEVSRIILTALNQATSYSNYMNIASQLMSAMGFIGTVVGTTVISEMTKKIMEAGQRFFFGRRESSESSGVPQNVPQRPQNVPQPLDTQSIVPYGLTADEIRTYGLPSLSYPVFSTEQAQRILRPRREKSYFYTNISYN